MKATAAILSVRCWRQDHSFGVELRDRGRTFDPALIPQPIVTGSLDQRRLGGLGLYLMHKIMDEVRFQFGEDENVLIMVKHNAVST